MPSPGHGPPRWAQWLFEQILSPEYDAVLGDLEEDFHDRAAYSGRRRAALHYCLDGFPTAPALSLYTLYWHHVMLKNYFKIAFRNLKKYKGFSAINIFGLALSMSVCLLIITVIKDQKGYDTFHPNADDLYRVTSNVEFSYGRYDMATSPAPLGPALRAGHPGVENLVRLSQFDDHALYQEQTFTLNGLYAEPSFFEIFGFDLVHGDEKTALSTPYSLILTEETAAKFFGKADAVGQVIHRDGTGDFTVTGVLKEQPHKKSHLRFEALASFSTLAALEAEASAVHLDDWENATTYYTYLLLAKGASPNEVAALSTDLAAQHHTSADRSPSLHRLQPITSINLGPELSNQISASMPREAAYFLSILALVLLLTAVFNYVSLSVARSLKRAREIGIRKVVGAHRGQIIRQFLSEAVIVALVALGLASILLVWLLPGFNNLQMVREDIAAPISLDLAGDVSVYLLFLGFAAGVGLLAGLYPALKLSAYVPVDVLKGLSTVKGFTGLGLRKVLVVVQFVLSIVGIVTTVMIYQQVSMVMRARYGFDEEQLVTMAVQGVSPETLRNELLRQPGVVSVTMVSTPPVVGSNSNATVQREGMDQPILMRYYAVDEGFLGEFRVTLLAGRNFSKDFATDPDEALLLTKQALATLDFESPQEAVGSVVTFGERPYTIIGVIDDFFADTYEDGFRALALVSQPVWYRYAMVRVRPGDVEDTMARLETTWKALAPTLAFEATFFNDHLMQGFQAARDMMKIIGFVAGFIVLIACLGLLGMASYTAETRVKEVGIRKVLGADVRSVVVLLSSDYVKLLVLAVVVATPLAWLLCTFFLQNFANRIDLNVWLFAAGIGPLLLLALLTIGSQTIRAGLTNPVDTLRHE